LRRRASRIWIRGLAFVTAGAAVLALVPEPGRTLPKELLRRVWWWSQALPWAEGPWQAGLTRITIPASAQFGRFEVDLLYPADERAGRGAKLRAALWRMLRPTSAPIVPDAPVSAAAPPLPVVVYFPSWFSRSQENSFTLANLARHGFAVLALDDIVHLPLTSWSERVVQAAVLDMSTEAAFARTRDLAGHRMALEARLGSVVLDAVAAQWGAALDLGRVTAVGFSFGGGAAAAMSLSDRRVKAVVNLDGSLFGEAARQGVPCPYLAIFSGNVVPTQADLTQPDLPARFEAIMNQEELARQARDRDRTGHWTLLMAGAEHLDFSDRLVAPAFVDQRPAKQMDRLTRWSALNDQLHRFLRDPRGAVLPCEARGARLAGVIRALQFNDDATVR
jgi:dienelactone hydrolase